MSDLAICDKLLNGSGVSPTFISHVYFFTKSKEGRCYITLCEDNVSLVLSHTTKLDNLLK
jgi:hypothetical protein